jgi:hypothetical protein
MSVRERGGREVTRSAQFVTTDHGSTRAGLSRVLADLWGNVRNSTAPSHLGAL